MQATEMIRRTYEGLFGSSVQAGLTRRLLGVQEESGPGMQRLGSAVPCEEVTATLTAVI